VSEIFDPYTDFVAGSLLVQALLVLSLYVVFQCGVLSLASVGFMAVGAYTASLLSLNEGWATVPAVVAGTLMGAAVAVLFGRVVLRLEGIYLALGTFALGQVCVLAIANVDYTGGAQGLVGMPTSVLLVHLVAVVVMVGVGFQLLHRSRHGRALRAVRLDSRVASGVGIDVARYRLAAFVASGALAGLAGSLEAFRTSVISPEQYGFTLLVQVLALAIIGGAFHWSGAVLAAIGIGVLQQFLGEVGPLLEGVLFGGLIILVMMLLPEGLTDRRGLRWAKARLSRRAPHDGPPPGEVLPADPAPAVAGGRA
jgi:branched-chain amino acid transport system permease protein